MEKKPKQIAPISIRLTPELDKRFAKCAEKTKQTKHSLARDALEAAVEAIERNGYRLVVPIEFEVTHVPAKTEASAPEAARPGAVAGRRSTVSTATRREIREPEHAVPRFDPDGDPDPSDASGSASPDAGKR